MSQSQSESLEMSTNTHRLQYLQGKVKALSGLSLVPMTCHKIAKATYIAFTSKGKKLAANQILALTE